MSYLLIDSVKTKFRKKHLPGQLPDTAVFINAQTARRFEGLSETAELVRLPERKAWRAIFSFLRTILEHHDHARIAVVSRRRRLRAAVRMLELQYPDAELFCRKKFGKKIRRFLAQTETPPALEDSNAETGKLPENTAQCVLADAENQPAVSETVLAMLRKNRPKKKADLFRLLEQYGEEAETVFRQLQQQGNISVDAAENIRYR